MSDDLAERLQKFLRDQMRPYDELELRNMRAALALLTAGKVPKSKLRDQAYMQNWLEARIAKLEKKLLADTDLKQRH